MSTQVPSTLTKQADDLRQFSGKSSGVEMRISPRFFPPPKGREKPLPSTTSICRWPTGSWVTLLGPSGCGNHLPYPDDFRL